jgi:hypothetical protein
MQGMFDAARDFTAAHPLALLFVSALALQLWRHGATQRGTRPPPTVASILAVGVLALYAGIVSWYSMLDEYYNLAEPSISAVAWLVRLGESPYHAADAAPRYAHADGPSLFLLHAAAYRLLGSGIWVSKLVGGISALSAVAVLFGMLTRIRTQASAVLWTAMVTIALLAFGNISFWTRAEPLLILCVVTGLAASLARSTIVAVLGVGLALGLATSLKVTGGFYLLPVISVVLRQHRPIAILWVPIVAVVVVAVPFAVLPSPAWNDFFFWFSAASRNGLRLALLPPNIEWTVYLAMPLALAYLARERRAARSEHIVLAIAATLVIITAAKPGAGPHHLLPFVPLIAWLAAEATTEQTSSWSRRAVIAYMVPMIITAAIQQFLFVSTMRSTISLQVGDDVRSFLQRHPTSPVGVGYGGSSPDVGSASLTYIRPLVVFQTGSYLLDVPAIQEHQVAGVEIPEATLQALGRCDVKYWLIPRAEEPFTTRNLYPQTGHRPLFNDGFTRTFNQHFALTSTTRLFDVYSCTNAPAFAQTR